MIKLCNSLIRINHLSYATACILLIHFMFRTHTMQYYYLIDLKLNLRISIFSL